MGTPLDVGKPDPYPDLPMFSDLPDHFCTKYIAGLDAHSDSWWGGFDASALLPSRVHAALINNSYRMWRYCSFSE